MWVPWTLAEGPDFNRTLQEARARSGNLERFDANLVAARFALKRDPRGYSTAFLEERDDLRVFMTEDPASDYRLVIFFKVMGEYALQLEWAELQDL